LLFVLAFYSWTFIISARSWAYFCRDSPSEWEIRGYRRRDYGAKAFLCLCMYFCFFFFCHFPPFLFSYVNGASADAVLFILCPTQSYNLTVILLQHLIKINKCMSRREKGVGPRSSRTPGLLFLSVLFLVFSGFFSRLPSEMVCPALAWTNGAWFCGSMRFILSVGIKIKMLVICLGFLFSCRYSCPSLLFFFIALPAKISPSWSVKEYYMSPWRSPMNRRHGSASGKSSVG